MLAPAGVLLLASIASAQITQLDWNTVDWGYGNISQTFSNVDGSGIDVTISLTLSADTATFSGWEYNDRKKRWEWQSYTSETHWLPEAPNDTSDFGGDGSAQSDESLYLGLNFASNNRNQSYLDVTITFSEAVNDVNFSLFDVDASGTNYTGGFETGIQFVDIIEQIQGSYQGNAVSGSVTHDSTKILAVTNPSGDAYQGNTRLDSHSDQDDNPRSQLNLGWSSPVDTVSFRYTTGSGAVADPGQQAIGLSNIRFSQYQAVPEPGTILIGALSGVAVIGYSIRRRRKPKSHLLR